MNSAFVAVVLDLSLAVFDVGKHKYHLLVGFEFITAVIIDIFTFWIVASCNFIGVYGHFGRKCAAIYRS
jgi:hypothetical protein